MIDAHSQVDKDVSMEYVLSQINEAGVSRSILSSLRGNSRTREIVAMAKLNPDRITPSIGMKSPELQDGDPAALARVRRMGAAPVFGAISEAMVCHHKKGAKAPEIIRGLDDPEIVEALDVAMKRRWPFVIHIEFGYSRCQTGAYMQELERLLARHPDQPVALTHMGQLGLVEVRRLIESHQNIYFLTSHANPVFVGQSEEHWTNLFAGEVLTPEWKELFMGYQDRFVLAFDNVYNDDWGDFYLRQVRLWNTAFKDLPVNVAHAVAHQNAERLWHLPPLSRAETSSAAGGDVEQIRQDVYPLPTGPAASTEGKGEVLGPGGLTARQVITRNDKNGDDKLAPDEFRGPLQKFQKLDANDDGFVTTGEFEASWLRLGDNAPITNEPNVLLDSAKDFLGRLIASAYNSETTVDGRRRGEPHKAIDIRGKIGDDILAVADGRVTFAGDTARGLAIYIAHGKDLDEFWYFTSYFHNTENLVKKGDLVKRGQVIAHLGDSGTKTIPHVHFGVFKSPTKQMTRDEKNIDVDPGLYWQADKLCFNSGERYAARPLRFTLPVRCVE